MFDDQDQKKNFISNKLSPSNTNLKDENFNIQLD